MVLKIAGWIRSSNAKMVETRIRKQLAERNSDEVVLDMRALKYISGAGLQMIRNLKKDYPNIRIINVSHDIYKTLYIEGFAEMIPLEKRRFSKEKGIVFTTDDGSFSIEIPRRNPDGDAGAWKQSVDPNHWFTISDGKSTVTIDRLSNKEGPPQVQIAEREFGRVIQAFASIKDEMFVVKVVFSEEADLQLLMEIVGTAKIIKKSGKN